MDNYLLNMGVASARMRGEEFGQALEGQQGMPQEDELTDALRQFGDSLTRLEDVGGQSLSPLFARRYRGAIRRDFEDRQRAYESDLRSMPLN